MRECEKKEPGGWGSANKWQRGQAPPKTNTEPQGRRWVLNPFERLYGQVVFTFVAFINYLKWQSASSASLDECVR